MSRKKRLTVSILEGMNKSLVRKEFLDDERNHFDSEDRHSVLGRVARNAFMSYCESPENYMDFLASLIEATIEYAEKNWTGDQMERLALSLDQASCDANGVDVSEPQDSEDDNVIYPDNTLRTVGRYHFVINAARNHIDKSGNACVRFDFEVTSDSCVCQQLREQDFYIGSPRLLKIAEALHLSERQTGRQFNADDAVGCQFFANVAQSGSSFHIGEEIYSITDDLAKNFPRNQALIDDLLNWTGPSSAE